MLRVRIKNTVRYLERRYPIRVEPPRMAAAWTGHMVDVSAADMEKACVLDSEAYDWCCDNLGHNAIGAYTITFKGNGYNLIRAQSMRWAAYRGVFYFATKTDAAAFKLVWF
jgi:hypothetical protein